MAEREVEKWVTVNGKHVPIYKDTPSDDKNSRIKQIENQEYQYHATLGTSVWSIFEKGLKPGRGHMGSGVYFAPDEQGALDWTASSSTGGTTLLRVKTQTLKDKYEWGVIDELESTADKKISPKDIEIKLKGSENSWMSLKEYAQKRSTSYKMWKANQGR